MVELQQIYMQNLIRITKQISQYKRTFVQVIVALSLYGPHERLINVDHASGVAGLSASSDIS